MDEEAELTVKYFKSPECAPEGSPSGIPEDHRRSFLWNFKNCYSSSTPEFWKQLREITKRVLTQDVRQCPRYVFLCGSPGSGKTHFEVGLYQALLKKYVYAGAGGVWLTTFLNIMKSLYEDYAETIRIKEALEACVRKAVGDFTTEDFLFMDDFTVSEKVFKKESMEYVAFQQILINRWETGGTLITSTNLNGNVLWEELFDLYDSHVASRLKNSVIIEFPNQDLRKDK